MHIHKRSKERFWRSLFGSYLGFRCLGGAEVDVACFKVLLEDRSERLAYAGACIIDKVSCLVSLREPAAPE
eukprot:1348955-Amphidinium_carterae.1